ncbi:hypothetical protein [Paraglaciecola sp. 2405UD69-4]|uniref:hypothetical protein n=1 Tax=Paraglaciecola sp. 2405UD69-4 TaxID=3391836 RepID=UPI0039C9E127
MYKNTNVFRRTLVLFILFISLPIQSEQIYFNKSKDGTDLNFHYQWTDSEDEISILDFTIPAKSLNTKNHKRFVADLAQQYVYIELHKEARNIDPREARIQIHKIGQDVQVQVKSRSSKLLTKWQQSMAISQEKAFDQYLEDNYYSRFHSYLGQEAVKPDHIRYINENKLALMPIAQAIYKMVPENSEPRVYINLLLSWVQSIPYDELQDRMTSNGAGYLPPLSVIANNIGDCDSKSVLMASLIRALLPNVEMVMVYLPNHALLGVKLPLSPSEKTYEIDGVGYTLMEPTGPAKIPLSNISNTSRSNILSRMYSYEKVI